MRSRNSAGSAGRILGISPGPVRIHRRNIYAELRNKPQGEQVLRFLDTRVDVT